MNLTRFNPWPLGIVATLILFAAGLAGVVIIASRQTAELVRPDYYEEEIRHEVQLERVRRTRPFLDQVALLSEPGVVRLRLPQGHAHAVGRVQFYRPSDQRLDRLVPLQLAADGTQTFAPLMPGLWRVRVYWSVHPKAAEEYFYEQTIVADPS